jgi:phosphatidylinositol alpha-1,6-mannosyltransferase
MSARDGILLISRNMPPLRGGMERLNAALARELASDRAVVVLSPKGTQLPPSENMVVRTSPLGGVGGFLLWAAFAAITESWRRRPSWVLGGSGLVAPVVWLAARVGHSRSAIYVHGLDIVVDNALYRRLWLPAIRQATRVVANSRNTARLAVEAGVDGDRINIICPGVSLPGERRADVGAFRKKHALGEGDILLSVGRLTKRKGLASFVEHALPTILRSRPGATLLVIGDNAQDALVTHGSSERTRTIEIAERLGIAESVRMLGPVSEEELHAAYDASTVHVFPVRDVPGDVEGFGMVAIEAAAQGLPTVAFACGGIPDAVADGVSGRLVAGGDYDAFAAAIIDVATAGRDVFDQPSKAFAARFEWSLFGERMRAAIPRRDIA